MSKEKTEAWSKDDALKFWDTADWKAVKDKTKRIIWLEISESEEMFTCYLLEISVCLQ